MKQKEGIKGTFYEVYEVDDRLVFRVYGKNNKVCSTYKILSKFHGIKSSWIVACLLSPLYFLLIIIDALILIVFSFLIITAIIVGADAYIIIFISFVLTFVYTFAIGYFFALFNPRFNERTGKTRRKS